MDWTRAIEINREALTRIVATLVALLAAQADAARLPVPVYQLIARVLHPVESAVRRLIVIAARGLVVPVVLSRPMPSGLVIERKGSRLAFPLFDTRKHFSDAEVDVTVERLNIGPRIRSVGDADPRSLFLAKFAKPDAGPITEAETLRIRSRVDLLKRALDTLPHQARRMARWRVRREGMTAPKFILPLRPGPPPGHRKKPRDEIDFVLRECHGLAWDALNNTS
jgi:hypothetical protein